MALLFYHGPCLDGEMCRSLLENKIPHLISISVLAGKLSFSLIQEKLAQNLERKIEQIFICDLSISQDILNSLELLPQKVYIFDHHKNLISFVPANITYISGTFCAAILTWNKMYPDLKEVPLMLKYIDDQDRGQHILPHTADVLNAIHFRKRTQNLFHMMKEFNLEEYKKEGTILTEYRQRQIKDMVQFGDMRSLEWKGKTYSLLLLTGDRSLRSFGLEESKAELTFFYTYDVKSNEFWIACRSRDIDLLPWVSCIRWLNVEGNFESGGGHSKACGFTVNNQTQFLFPSGEVKEISFTCWLTDLLSCIAKF